MSMFLCAIYAYVIKHLVLAPSETFFWVLEFVVILIENRWHTYLPTYLAVKFSTEH